MGSWDRKVLGGTGEPWPGRWSPSSSDRGKYTHRSVLTAEETGCMETCTIFANSLKIENYSKIKSVFLKKLKVDTP